MDMSTLADAYLMGYSDAQQGRMINIEFIQAATAGMSTSQLTSAERLVMPGQKQAEPGKRKRSTAYQRRYKKAFRKIAPKYKLKSGKWKKGGFKTAVKLAHKEARK